MESIKTELRRAMRVRRAALDSASTALAGLRLVEQLADFGPYRAAEVVLAYAAVGNELPTGPMLVDALARGKRVFLPRMDELWFAEYGSREQLERGAVGLPEPVSGARFEPGCGAAVVLVPLLAWDRYGGRLGRGTGWYDRVLPRLALTSVGVAYDFQERACVPIEPWDVKLDYVVTESRWIHCGTVPSGARLT